MLSRSHDAATLVPLKPIASIRQLTAADEEQFIHLLRTVYGESYSYRFLYEPGGFSSLLNSRQITSYGEFDANERLLAHTAFWHKERNSDYVESGCSFRISGGLEQFKSTIVPRAWQDVLQKFASEFSFVHQYNSTLHVLAQRYADRLMNAKYSGLILGYSANEKIKGVAHCADKMHALMMTSVLAPSLLEKEVYVAELFRPWLTDIYKNMGLPRQVHGVLSSENTKQSIDLHTLEINRYISLQRRLVQFSLIEKPTITRSSLRTDLIHLPIEDHDLVCSAFPILIESGYFPCGMRPHTNKSDELIFQNLIDYEYVIRHLSDAIKIAHALIKREVEEWKILILQIM